MRIALVIFGLVLTAGCGNGDSGGTDGPTYVPTGVVPTASATGTPGSEFNPPGADQDAEDLPACAEVWVVGKTLPDDYKGCTLSTGIDRGATYACTDGNGDLIGYNDQFFARLGGEIRAYGEDDTAFSQELFEVCKPESNPE